MKPPKPMVAAAALAVASLLPLYLVAVVVGDATAPETEVEAAIASGGSAVRRSAAGPILPLDAGATRPSLLLLGGTHALHAAEREAVIAYAEAGGEAWIASPSPDGFLPDEAEYRIRTYSGALYSSNGSLPRFSASTPAATVAPFQGVRALDLRDSRFAPVLNTTRDAFRDSNGNGRLDAGEPAGPFVVAAAAEVGQGRIVVVAGALADLPAPIFALLDPPSRGSGGVVVADRDGPGAWARLGLVLLTAASLPAAFTPATIAVALLAIVLALAASAQPPGHAGTPAAVGAADVVDRFRRRVQDQLRASAGSDRDAVQPSRGKTP